MKIRLSRTTSYGVLGPCQNFQKTNDTNPRKCLDRKNGQTKAEGPKVLQSEGLRVFWSISMEYYFSRTDG